MNNEEPCDKAPIKRRYQTKLKDGTIFEGTFLDVSTPKISHVPGTMEPMLLFGNESPQLIRWEDVQYCIEVDLPVFHPPTPTTKTWLDSVGEVGMGLGLVLLGVVICELIHIL